MSPHAKRLLRKPMRWEMVDRTDLAAVLVVTHLLMIFIGYGWGHR